MISFVTNLAAPMGIVLKNQFDVSNALDVYKRQALLEAAFMTGLERNADIVHMATYAPLFAHVEGWQWRPDMIWFDNLNSDVYKRQALGLILVFLAIFSSTGTLVNLPVLQQGETGGLSFGFAEVPIKDVYKRQL